MAEADAVRVDTPSPTPPSCATRRKHSLPQNDILKCRKAFNAYDFKKEARVQASAVKEIANRLGYRMTDDQIQKIYSNNELNGESMVSFEQFLEFVPRNNEQISEDEHRVADMREKFQRYDTDHDGVISLSEAQWALQMELDVSTQTALRLLNQFVKLDYDQFIDFYQQMQKTKMDIYQKFGAYDHDKDGMINGEDAHRILHEELGFSKEKSKAMVRHFDRNKDGMVSYVEFAEFYIAVEERKSKIRQTFQRYDTEGLGYVSAEQAKSILQNLLGFSEEKCQRTMDIYDKNSDGKIDYEEFLAFYSMLEEERQRLLLEFNTYDSDGDGKISYKEFQTLLTEQGYTEEHIQTLMGDYDENHDGYLDFDEFKRFLNFS